MTPAQCLEICAYHEARPKEAEMIARTPRGKPITCDGCGAAVEKVTAAMTHPLPRHVAITTYGKADLSYIVCAPLPDGRQPCLHLAQLADELYEKVRCWVPGCDGSRCQD